MSPSKPEAATRAAREGGTSGASWGASASGASTPSALTRTLRVDRVACSAHGACASLLPEHLRLDEWGYPVVIDARVTAEEARLAVTLCPARALWVQENPR